MAISTTRWHPDTCQCIIELDYDTTVPPQNQVGVPRTVSKCQYHQAAADSNAHHTAVRGENFRKNRFYGLLEENLAAAYDTITNADGTTYKRLKAGKTASWYFDEQRRLHITLGGFTTQEQNKITTFVNAYDPVNIVVEFI